MMRLLVVCLVAATLLWPALAQAPDADFECIRPGRTDPSPASYLEDQRILFDTWNYENLLGSGGVLQTLDIDGEGSGVSSINCKYSYLSTSLLSSDCKVILSNRSRHSPIHGHSEILKWPGNICITVVNGVWL